MMGKKLSSYILGYMVSEEEEMGNTIFFCLNLKILQIKSFSGFSCCVWCIVLSTRSMQGGFYYTHFIGEETEAQGDTARNW